VSAEAAADRKAWSPALVATLVVGLSVAGLIRLLLLPTPGLTGDLDQFVLWVHGIATQPLGRAYDQNISFPPVMVYIWAVLAAVEPAFRTATDSSDAWIRVLMKLPASLADFGLAAGVAYALRSRPVWAVVGALGIALHPAVIDVSAWWGQYESLYVLAALIAYLLATAGRPTLASIALAISLMTKPQALPLLIPFAAWFLARYGWRRSVGFGLLGAATIIVLWLPFVAAGGPASYVRNVSEYQSGVFGVLSLRAWNPWWLFQEAYGRQEFISDSAVIAGPITLRVIGYALALITEGIVFVAVLRRPTPAGLGIGLAAATVAAFVTLTAMHERYAYAALVFLPLAFSDRRVLAVWLAFGAVFTLNMVAAIPPTPDFQALVPIFGPFGVAGSLALTAIAIALIALVFRGNRWQRPT
jgi:Gpi18-like mannosyltransferase